MSASDNGTKNLTSSRQADHAASGSRTAGGENQTGSVNAGNFALPVSQESGSDHGEVAGQLPRTGTYEAREIIAQETMADASVHMAWAAMGTLAITLIGTAFLAWQVRLTRKAVADTSKATDAMLASNALARETSERELRAYLGLKHANMDHWGTSDPVIVLEIHNSGQTPAYDVQHALTLKICEKHERPEIPKVDRLVRKPRDLIAPGAALLERQYFGDQLDDEKRALLESGTLRAYVACLIGYRDVFGKRRHLRFRVSTDGRYFQHGLVSVDFHGDAEVDA